MNNKRLTEMTLEELWQLFPVVLVEHDARWARWYSEEAAAIRGKLHFRCELYHVGSTAIDGISAKPIIDILLAVHDARQMELASDIMQNSGYIVMSKSADRISLNKGYTESGYADKVFHLHIRLDTDIDEVYFRDYLNAHADVAKQYEALKTELCGKFKHDRDAYTAAKGEFVNIYTALGKRDREL